MARVVILGPGAVGGLLAAVLTRAGQDVLLVGRSTPGPDLALDVRSPRFGEIAVRVPAADHVGAREGDVLVVAVKAPALADALSRIDGHPDAVVPLLNGVEHVAVLRERFGGRVVAAVVRVQAQRDGPGRIVHRAPFLEITLAQPGCPPLGEALARAGVDVTPGGDEAAVLWGKLARLCGLALATAAADAPLGAVRDDARAVAVEVVAVARAEGAPLDPGALVAELDALPDAASSSLRADLAAGMPDELDAIAGAVLRAGGRHGLACPHTERLAGAVAARRQAR